MIPEPHHENPEYRRAYRLGWMAYCNGQPMPTSDGPGTNAGLRSGWMAAQRKYQADVIADLDGPE